jgi:hypothetical protein
VTQKGYKDVHEGSNKFTCAKGSNLVSENFAVLQLWENCVQKSKGKLTIVVNKKIQILNTNFPLIAKPFV